MAFIINKVDDLTLPQGLDRGDSQSIGDGVAAVDFVQMPGGGHFDNYGDDDSPRDASAITKQCVLYDGVGGLTILQQDDLLRAKLGKRVRVEVLWIGGTVRWTWARLVRVRGPRPFNAVRSLPVDITIMPQEGVWYAEDPVVEDTDFVATSMAEDIAITASGNVNITDPIVEFVIDYTGIFEVIFENYETSQQVTIEIGTEPGWRLVMDVGQRTVWQYETARALTTISRSGNVISLATGSAHGLVVGNEVYIDGTDYDGFYSVATVPLTTTLTLTADANVRQPHGPQTSTGTVSKVNEAYDNCTFSDKANWFWLVPGAQTIHLTADQDLNGGSFTVTYNPTYA